MSHSTAFNPKLTLLCFQPHHQVQPSPVYTPSLPSPLSSLPVPLGPGGFRLVSQGLRRTSRSVVDWLLVLSSSSGSWHRRLFPGSHLPRLPLPASLHPWGLHTQFVTSADESLQRLPHPSRPSPRPPPPQVFSSWTSAAFSPSRPRPQISVDRSL